MSNIPEDSMLSFGPSTYAGIVVDGAGFVFAGFYSTGERLTEETFDIWSFVASLGGVLAWYTGTGVPVVGPIHKPNHQGAAIRDNRCVDNYYTGCINGIKQDLARFARGLPCSYHLLYFGAMTALTFGLLWAGSLMFIEWATRQADGDRVFIRRLVFGALIVLIAALLFSLPASALHLRESRPAK